MRRQPQGGTFHIEDIQDQVELALMRSGEHDVARSYVLYREERTRARARRRRRRASAAADRPCCTWSTTAQRQPLDLAGARAPARVGLRRAGRRRRRRRRSCEATLRDLYDGVPMEEVRKSAILAARALIEKDPAYSYVTARLLLNTIRLEVLGEEVSQAADGGALRRLLSRVHPPRHRGRAARPAAGASSTWRASGRALKSERDLQVRLPRPADPVRPLLPAHARPAHRTAAGLLHARGDGPGAEREATARRAPSSSTTCCRPSTS